MAIVVIKSFHTVVFLVESAAILYIVYSGLSGEGRSPWLTIAVVLVLAEIAVYLGNRARCPLTNLARRLGDETGDDYIADIFMPRWGADLIPPVCGSLAVFGLAALALRWLLG